MVVVVSNGGCHGHSGSVVGGGADAGACVGIGCRPLPR